MKIAVTGATGFIGQYVIAALAQRGVETVAVVRRAETANLPDFGGSICECDLSCTPENVFELMGRPDALIHLAWSGLPNYMSLHHFEEELGRQYDFLNQVISSGLGALVVTGTCFEYGMVSGELSEDLLPNPANPYGYAKNALRCQLEYLQQKQPFALNWARLFYMYGEGQSKKSLFSQLQECAKEPGSVFNMSQGEQLRDYLHVSEVADYLVRLALTPEDRGVLNICSGMPISIRKLVEDWVKEYGLDINLNLGYYPYPAYEPLAFWGRSHKLDTMLPT